MFVGAPDAILIGEKQLCYCNGRGACTGQSVPQAGIETHPDKDDTHSQARPFMIDRTKGLNPEDEAAKAFKEFFAEVNAAGIEQARFGKAAPAAMRRLAAAVYGHDNSQAQTVAACLASIYNGSEALPVRLDEIRALNWSLQRDLITVLIGTGHAGCADSDIRTSFFEVGGAAAVEWLHWYTTGGPHRAALERIVKFIATDSYCSTASILRNALRSIYNGTTVLSVGKLSYVGDLGSDMALVLDGIIGRYGGTIRETDIEYAFREGGIADALTEENWPKAKPDKKAAP